jgi:pimeloyl-ACP methyl ester carboxylesterase
VVSPINALILAEQLPNAQLIVYSDSNHGAQYQHRDLFLEHVKLFLKLSGSLTGTVQDEQETLEFSTRR